MINLTIRHLIDLAASGATRPEANVQTVFEWAHSRRLELVKWLFALAVALFAPVVIVLLRGEVSSTVSRWWVASALFGSVAVACYGLYLLLTARRMYQTYLAAQALLGEIQKIGPFLDRYRQEVERQ